MDFWLKAVRCFYVNAFGRRFDPWGLEERESLRPKVFENRRSSLTSIWHGLLTTVPKTAESECCFLSKQLKIHLQTKEAAAPRSLHLTQFFRRDVGCEDQLCA